MANAEQRNTAASVLEKHGRTFGDDVGYDPAKNTPNQLFGLLCFSLLASARIGHEQAVEAARALRDAGWTTPGKMRDSTWEQRVKVLNEHGYARYDESTARMLGDVVDKLLEDYDGDLRQLRERAEGDPKRIHSLLQELKGIGRVGADIFCREAQGAWEELRPFVDERPLRVARRLGLPDDPADLEDLVGVDQLPRLVSGLMRIDLTDAYDNMSPQ